MKTLLTTFAILLASQISFAACEDTALVTAARGFDLAGTFEMKNEGDDEVITETLVRKVKGDEEYDFFAKELQAPLEMVSDVFVGESGGLLFVRDTNTCLLSLMSSNGDDGYLYTVIKFTSKAIRTVEADSGNKVEITRKN